MRSSRVASATEDVEHQVKASIDKLFRMAESDAKFMWRKLVGSMEDNDVKHCSREKKTHVRSSLWNFWAKKELYEKLGGGGVSDCSSGGSLEDITVSWIQKYLRNCPLHKGIAEKEDEHMMIIRFGRKIKKLFKKKMKPTAAASANVQSNLNFSISWGCVSFHSEVCVKKPLWCKSLLS